MAIVALFIAGASFVVGYWTGKAREHNAARERLRLKVLDKNIGNLSPERIQELLTEI